MDPVVVVILVVWFSLLGIWILRQLNHIRWYVAKINYNILRRYDERPPEWEW